MVEVWDPDGDPITVDYDWSVDGASRSREAQFSTQGLRRGSRVGLRVSASDGEDRSGEARAPDVLLGNAPPVIASQPGDPDADGTFRYQIRATDPEGDKPLRFELVRGPKGMEVDPRRGNVEWTPGSLPAGTHVVELAVEDSLGARSIQRFEFVVDESPAAPDRSGP